MSSAYKTVPQGGSAKKLQSECQYSAKIGLMSSASRLTAAMCVRPAMGLKKGSSPSFPNCAAKLSNSSWLSFWCGNKRTWCSSHAALTAHQRVTRQSILADPGPENAAGALNYQERLSLFRSAERLAQDPATALRAGQRQLGRDYFSLSGSLFRISLDIKADVGVFRSYNPESLGPALPFVAEYWRSSQSKVCSLVLGRRFPSLHMSFPYPAPEHAAVYREVFRCPVRFNSDQMEWHFDAKVLSEPCTSADPGVAQLCRHYCAQFVERGGGRSFFQQEVLSVCVRNLASASVQAAHDRLRRSVALEYLKNTSMSVEDVASRCGYQDVSNFRKAFRRWTGRTPSSYRNAQ